MTRGSFSDIIDNTVMKTEKLLVSPRRQQAKAIAFRLSSEGVPAPQTLSIYADIMRAEALSAHRAKTRRPHIICKFLHTK